MGLYTKEKYLSYTTTYRTTAHVSKKSYIAKLHKHDNNHVEFIYIYIYIFVFKLVGRLT